VNINVAANAVHGVRVREFLADSLALWRVEGTVEAGALPAVAVIHASGGTTVWIERPAGIDVSWRWFVRWRSPDMRDERARPCASLVGLLNAVRGALGVERGNALRIAAAPVELPPLR
jgi:hypothetical protein